MVQWESRIEYFMTAVLPDPHYLPDLTVASCEFSSSCFYSNPESESLNGNIRNSKKVLHLAEGKKRRTDKQKEKRLKAKRNRFSGQLMFLSFCKRLFLFCLHRATHL